jgi:hypothetical protein
MLSDRIDEYDDAKQPLLKIQSACASKSGSLDGPPLTVEATIETDLVLIEKQFLP